MKENKEIKTNEELKATETQETEVQENQQAEAPAQEQKQEEKAKESIWSKVGRYAKAGAKKVGAGIKKAAPIALVGTVVGGVLYFKGQADAYNSMLSGDGTEGENIPELPETTEPAPEIEDAEFKEISTDEQSVE